MGVWLPVESVACLSFCDNVCYCFLSHLIHSNDTGRWRCWKSEFNQEVSSDDCVIVQGGT